MTVMKPLVFRPVLVVRHTNVETETEKEIQEAWTINCHEPQASQVAGSQAAVLGDLNEVTGQMLSKSFPKVSGPRDIEMLQADSSLFLSTIAAQSSTEM